MNQTSEALLYDRIDQLKAENAVLKEKLRLAVAAQERMAAGYEKADLKAREKENELVAFRAKNRSLVHLVDDEADTLKAICGEKISPHFKDLDLTRDIEKCSCTECLRAYSIGLTDHVRLLADENDRYKAKVDSYMELASRMRPAQIESKVSEDGDAQAKLLGGGERR
jgi:hypothetical protein